MKKLNALLATAVIGLLLYSCQKETLPAPASTFNATSLSTTDRDGCIPCVNEWIDSKVTIPFAGNPTIVVDVWNDNLATHYTVRRTDGGTWTNIRYAVGCVGNSGLGGSPTVVYPANTFEIPNPTNWETCDNNSRTVTIKLNGASGIGSPLECITYTLSNLQPDAAAGENQSACNTSEFTVTGTTNVGTGTWSILTGSATITDPTAATTTVTGVASGQSVTVLWTATNGTCTDGAEVTLTNEACNTICYNENAGKSAVSAGSPYVNNCEGNTTGAPWATYTQYMGASNTVALQEGNNHTNVGTVQFSAPNNGMVTITITLNAGFGFKDTAENVKIQGYASDPVCLDHAPGHFAHKAKAGNPSPYSMTVPAASFYGVHVDLVPVIACPQ